MGGGGGGKREGGIKLRGRRWYSSYIRRGFESQKGGWPTRNS